MTSEDVLERAGLTPAELGGGSLAVRSPIDGAEIARIRETRPDDMPAVIDRARNAFLAWREVPAPRRGELVRLLGEELRASKEALGALVTLEVGKIVSEGLGEVQEMIDICDFAVGLSRQLHGLVIASERPGHRMAETWHPLGPCAIISAFNFPVAVWSWNAALALVCGDPVIWKPSEKTPLSALATMKILARAIKRFGPDAPEGLAQIVIGGPAIGEALVASKHVPVVSATGSTRMGSIVGPKVAARFGRPILELGGNNAMIVAPSADLDMAMRAIVFSAVGTAGQRCTSLRRLIVHRSIRAELTHRLVKAYSSLPIGDPRKEGTLVGPLIDHAARDKMQAALARARDQGGLVHGGRTVAEGAPNGGAYVEPAIVEMPGQIGHRARGDLRADPLHARLRRPRTRRSRSTTTCPRACRRRSSPSTCARRIRFFPPPVRTAASPTSTSARRGPRSAAPSAARRRPAAAARAAPTPGSPTCAGRRAR